MHQHPASSAGVTRNGVSRNTIQSIEIASQCVAHAGWESALTIDPFKDTGRDWGYMDLPASPTPGEFLYLNHWRFDGGLTTFATCDCAEGSVRDAVKGEEVAAPGHVGHRFCKVHDGDKNHDRAKAEHLAWDQAQQAFLKATATPLTVADQAQLRLLIAAQNDVPLSDVVAPTHLQTYPFRWTFTETRELVVLTDHLPEDVKASVDSVVAQVAGVKGPK